jgi:hypothetical protein
LDENSGSVLSDSQQLSASSACGEPLRVAALGDVGVVEVAVVVVVNVVVVNVGVVDVELLKILLPCFNECVNRGR